MMTRECRQNLFSSENAKSKGVCGSGYQRRIDESAITNFYRDIKGSTVDAKADGTPIKDGTLRERNER